MNDGVKKLIEKYKNKSQTEFDKTIVRDIIEDLQILQSLAEPESQVEQVEIEPKKLICNHDKSGPMYLSNPPQWKCDVCGQYYR